MSRRSFTLGAEAEEVQDFGSRDLPAAWRASRMWPMARILRVAAEMRPTSEGAFAPQGARRGARFQGDPGDLETLRKHADHDLVAHGQGP